MGSNREPLSEDEESRRSRSVTMLRLLCGGLLVFAREKVVFVIVVTARPYWFYVKNT
jgi:hypothetical protein